MSYNTYIVYNGDNTTTDFSIPFEYVNQSEVVVTRKNGSVSYVYVNASLIRLSAPLASGDTLTVQRDTNLTAASVVWTAGTGVTGPQANIVVTQLLNGIQEAKDKPGPTGATGSNGTNGISFTWKGVWSNATAYVFNDVVQYNGSSYICVTGNTNKVPDVNVEWSLVAQKGATGASGTGTGDMVKATYDTNNNGIVDAAEAVPWAGITSKPTFNSLATTTLTGTASSTTWLRGDGAWTAIATVATTGAYADLTGKPTLGTGAALDYGIAAGNLVRLDATTSKLPAVDGSLLTNLPTGSLTHKSTIYTSSATHTTQTGVKFMRIRGVGGGGGGNGASNGGNGGNTTFVGTGVSLSFGGGAGATGVSMLGGAGGSTTGCSVFNRKGPSGGSSAESAAVATAGNGGNSPFGVSGVAGYNGSPATANAGTGYGAGGTGGSFNDPTASGGGGAGGDGEHYIDSSFAATYTVTIGAAGSAGSSAAAGLPGLVIVEEWY